MYGQKLCKYVAEFLSVLYQRMLQGHIYGIAFKNVMPADTGIWGKCPKINLYLEVVARVMY